MIPPELQTLIERRDYLAERIKAKQKVEWETTYDQREHDALCWVIRVISEEPGDGA